jgi:hypothetical protein
MRRFLAFCAFVAAATPHWWWEFVRSFILYEPASHFLKEQVAAMSVDTIIQVASGITFAGLGTWLIWPSRPELLKIAKLKMFLERDSESDQIGIQTFPALTYIQISVTSSKRITNCKAWYRRSHYSPDGTVAFALEHNERHQLPWSKSGFEIDMNPHDGPVRINVAVHDNATLAFEQGTPTNLLQNLQRPGIHRFEISVVGFVNDREISEKCYLFIDWRGPGKRTAFVELRKYECLNTR